MITAMARIVCLLALGIHASVGYSQQIDPRVLEDMRKRYRHSFESIYVSDTALNNLSVHLRTQRALDAITKAGTSTGVLQILRKFLEDVANDRAFLQLELRELKAGYKKQSDASVSIQQLPWRQSEVFHIAVLCDRYLQGQIKLADLKKQLAADRISVGETWMKFGEFRTDPYVPAVTMVEVLTDFASFTDRHEAEVSALATKDPGSYNGIRIFKAHVADKVGPKDVYFATDWPNPIKAQWVNKYKVLEGYARSTDESSAPVWHAQLDTLQRLEYTKLLRAIAGTKP